MQRIAVGWMLGRRPRGMVLEDENDEEDAEREQWRYPFLQLQKKFCYNKPMRLPGFHTTTATQMRSSGLTRSCLTRIY